MLDNKSLLAVLAGDGTYSRPLYVSQSTPGAPIFARYAVPMNDTQVWHIKEVFGCAVSLSRTEIMFWPEPVYAGDEQIIDIRECLQPVLEAVNAVAIVGDSAIELVFHFPQISGLKVISYRGRVQVHAQQFASQAAVEAVSGMFGVALRVVLPGGISGSDCEIEGANTPEKLMSLAQSIAELLACHLDRLTFADRGEVIGGL